MKTLKKILATKDNLDADSIRIAALLKKKKIRLVLAESCTGGMAASALTGVPGISEFFCGSAVVYRIDTKRNWLKIHGKTLDKFGSVSPQTSVAMAVNALKKTPEADISGAITGELGPGSPQKTDGLIFIAVAARKKNKKGTTVFIAKGSVAKITGTYKASSRSNKAQKFNLKLRQQRQIAASHSLLLMVRSLLESTGE